MPDTTNSIFILLDPDQDFVGAKRTFADGSKSAAAVMGFRFRWEERYLNDLDEVEEFLNDLAFQPDRYPIYGLPTEAWPEDTLGLRRSVSRPDEPATLTLEGRYTKWLIVDVDGWEMPAGHDVEYAIEKWLEDYADPCAGCCAVLTGSHKLGSGLLNVRLFIELAEPRTVGQLKAWARSTRPGSKADLAIYRAVQPIYVAHPICLDNPKDCNIVTDPISQRLFRFDGDPMHLPEDLTDETPAATMLGKVEDSDEWPDDFRSVVHHFERRNEVLAQSPERIDVVCPWKEHHTTESADSSTSLLTPREDQPGAFRCLHSHCEDRSIEDVVTLSLRTSDERIRDRIAEIAGSLQEQAKDQPAQPRNTQVEKEATAETALKVNLKRYVLSPYGASTPMVFDLKRRTIMTLKNWTAMTDNQPRFPHPGRGMPIPQAASWKNSPLRDTAEGPPAYYPGSDAMTIDPYTGLRCPNQWVPPIWAEPARMKAAVNHSNELTLALEEHLQFLDPHNWDAWMDFIADMVQNPMTRPKWAILHISPRHGTGRGWLRELLSSLLGVNNVHLSPVTQLDGQFNSWMEGSQLCIVDEVSESDNSYRGRVEQGKRATHLNELITEKRIRLEEKGINARPGNAHFRLLMFSNFLDALSIGLDDRRVYTALYEGSPKPAAYYDRIYALMDVVKNPDRAAANLQRLYYDLATRKIETPMHRMPERLSTGRGKEVKELMAREGMSPTTALLTGIIDSLRHHGMDLFEIDHIKMVLDRLQEMHPDTPILRKFEARAMNLRELTRTLSIRSLLTHSTRGEYRTSSGRRYRLYGLYLPSWGVPDVDLRAYHVDSFKKGMSLVNEVAEDVSSLV